MVGRARGSHCTVSLRVDRVQRVWFRMLSAQTECCRLLESVSEIAKTKQAVIELPAPLLTKAVVDMGRTKRVPL